jgi:hypothetical protein
MAALHVLQDRALKRRVRGELQNMCSEATLSTLASKELTHNVLLSSIYAETCRKYITVFIPVIPRYGDLDLGRWRTPQSSYGLINSAVAQMNPDVWNDREGAYPVDSFWADRFIVDPSDPLSGPVRPENRAKYGVKPGDATQPYFSTEGLEGSWIPFGGNSVASCR